MDNNLLNIFSKAFLEANDGKVKFPENFQLDKINEIEIYTDGMRGGYKVRFFIKQNNYGKWYLDLFGRNDYCSWHKRIDENGAIINLNNFKGEFGRPIYPDDPERTKREHKEIQDNNDSVHKLLIEKGLERNFNNPEFESQNVVKLTDYNWK
ncbi:MAG: hypothetical protein ACWA41_06035 [Putridiphycobacter sp.]